MVLREWRSEGQHDFTDAIYGEDGDEDEVLFSIRLYHYGTWNRGLVVELGTMKLGNDWFL